MNILGIDFGTKNIGLAWVNTDLGVVLPFGIIKNHKSEIINGELEKLIKEENVNKIVVGLPTGLDGKENENTKRIRNFSDELKKLIKIPIEFADERFSSYAADRMGSGGASRDEKAAMVILQTYLEMKKDK